ncbi:MAG: hypothetical protein WBQ43_16505 [Terriglobales bacterium]
MHFRSERGLFVATVALVCFGVTFAAQAQSKSAPAQTTAPTAKSANNEDAQLYRNTTFGFRYPIPYGWVDRTKDMHEGSEPGKTEVLLAVFERPPEATGDTINSAVVFASESVASYPGLKKAEDYLGPLTELATSKGFKPDGEPYALEVESRQLLRADFIKSLEVKTTSAQLTMRQCTLVLLAKGQIVSFTFIAGSEDEIDDLMDGLHFGATKPAPPRSSTH